MNVTVTPETIVLLPVLLFSLICHEIGHAYVAYLGGDDTAKLQGRVSLNPLPHIDPFGTVLIPIMQMFTSFPLIGWAKPVPVNPSRLRSAKWDLAVSLSGVGVNLGLALAAAVLYKIFLLTSFAPDFWGRPDPVTIPYLVSVILRGLILVNLALMLFNLLPIPPLDGSHVLAHFVAARNTPGFRVLEFLERFGYVILILFVVTGGLWFVLEPVLNSMIWFLGFVLGIPLRWFTIPF
jgi:Zn-dependent protease